MPSALPAKLDGFGWLPETLIGKSPGFFRPPTTFLITFKIGSFEFVIVQVLSSP